IIGMMVEDVSIRVIIRMTGASKNTVAKLLADACNALIVKIASSAIRHVRAYKRTKSEASFIPNRRMFRQIGTVNLGIVTCGLGGPSMRIPS
ncbi:MAG: hypothetical protein ACREQX_05640, partial [Candidatus Binataceae bacterium]